MAESGPKRRAQKDRERAAELKRLGVERTVQRCPVCYRIISAESRISRYTHICKGG